jgi:hypothetical protein
LKMSVGFRRDSESDWGSQKSRHKEKSHIGSQRVYLQAILGHLYLFQKVLRVSEFFQFFYYHAKWRKRFRDGRRIKKNLRNFMYETTFFLQIFEIL